MYLNNYSVRVLGGHEDCGYVEMTHGQRYRLVLRNDASTRCDAKVSIDGKHVGTWRINAGESITLERPAHDTGCFTFYEAGTADSGKAGLESVNKIDLGLVSVTFIPEQTYVAPPVSITWTSPDTVRPTWSQEGSYFIRDSVSSGGTAANFTDDSWSVSLNADELPIGSSTYVSCSVAPSVVSNAANFLSHTRAVPARNAGGTGLSGASDQKFFEVPDLLHDFSRVTTINLRLVAKRNSCEPRPLTQYSTPVPPPVC